MAQFTGAAIYSCLNRKELFLLKMRIKFVFVKGIVSAMRKMLCVKFDIYPRIQARAHTPPFAVLAECLARTIRADTTLRPVRMGIEVKHWPPKTTTLSSLGICVTEGRYNSRPAWRMGPSLR